MGAVGTWRASSPPVLVIALDGHGASGKSTFAEALVARLGAAVVHTDDFFRQTRLWPSGGSQHDHRLSDYYDWRRLRAEALAPLRAGREAVYRRYDWELGEVAGPDVTVKPRAVVVLEGVFSSAPQLGDVVERSVLVDTPEDERLRRLEARISPEEWDADWLAAESAYFKFVRPPSSFDIVVSGAAPARAELPGGRS